MLRTIPHMKAMQVPFHLAYSSLISFKGLEWKTKMERNVVRLDTISLSDGKMIIFTTLCLRSRWWLLLATHFNKSVKLYKSQVVPFWLQYKYATPSMLLHIAVKRVFIARNENAPKPNRERGFKLQWLTLGSIKPRTRVRREAINLRGKISCSNSLLGMAY